MKVTAYTTGAGNSTVQFSSSHELVYDFVVQNTHATQDLYVGESDVASTKGIILKPNGTISPSRAPGAAEDLTKWYAKGSGNNTTFVVMTF